jgi:MFS transporter, DHA1 family, inner membrane transport protein
MRLRRAAAREGRACRGIVLLRVIRMTSRPTVLASIVLALALLGDSLLYAVLPLHASTFGISLAWTGVLLSANRIVRLFAYPFLPRIAGTGLRRFTVIAAAVGAASTLTFAIGSGAWPLLASRIGWGVAFGCLSLSTLAYATATGAAAGKRVGLSYSLRELGPLLSLTAGTAAVAMFGVRSALAALGIASLAGIWIATFLPDPVLADEPRPTNAVRKPWKAEGLSLFAGFVTDGIFPTTAGLLLAGSGGASAVVGAGLMLGFKRIAAVVLGPAGGHAADRFGGGIVTASGFAMAASGAFLIAFDHVIAGGVLLSCGGAVTATTIPVSVATRDAMDRVTGFARIGMARDAGAAAGPLVALALFDAAGASVLYWVAGALLATIAALTAGASKASCPARA